DAARSRRKVTWSRGEAAFPRHEEAGTTSPASGGARRDASPSSRPSTYRAQVCAVSAVSAVIDPAALSSAFVAGLGESSTQWRWIRRLPEVRSTSAVFMRDGLLERGVWRLSVDDWFHGRSRDEREMDGSAPVRSCNRLECARERDGYANGTHALLGGGVATLP